MALRRMPESLVIQEEVNKQSELLSNQASPQMACLEAGC